MKVAGWVMESWMDAHVTLKKQKLYFQYSNKNRPDGVLNFNYFEHKLFTNELDPTMFRM